MGEEDTLAFAVFKKKKKVNVICFPARIEEL